jgi:hypothetical protein
MEQSRNIPFVSKVPTIIFGMDVSHGSPGQSDIPSIAAVGHIWDEFFLRDCLFITITPSICSKSQTIM